jgi:flavin reductase (DIM6/NTAB) family NADH-FMN oxidoreductase RutF
MTVDPLEFRSIMGHFATGVTVVTAAAGDELQGMTANAVCSLSLDPVLLLVCVDKTTHTHGVIERAGAFAVHILADDQEDVSRIFARKLPPQTGSLRGQRYRRGESGSPLLEDCLAYIDCRVADMLQGGDHSIFIGEVVAQRIVRDGARPLLFYRGGYHRMSDRS